MLIRNIDPKNGLLNGTRMVIQEMHDHIIKFEILKGNNKGCVCVIPRIDIAPSETQLPFVLKRRQFPIIPAFAMTIHKAQGQSFDKVGLYLPQPVFAHGQLYVALSRVKDNNNLKIFIEKEAQTIEKGKVFIENVVYKELL